MDEIKSKTNFFIILIVLGFTEGLLLFALNLGLQRLWISFIQFNNFFENLLLIQEISLFFLIFVSFGYFSIKINNFSVAEYRNKKMAVILSGIVASIVYIISTDFYIAITKLIGYQYYQKYLVPNDPFYLKFYLSILSSFEILPFLFVVTALSVLIHAIGAALHNEIVLSSKQISSEKNRDYLKKLIFPNCSLVFFCGGILILLIFPAISYVGIVTGVIEHKYGCDSCIYFDLVSVEKTGNNSVEIILRTEDPSTFWLPHEKRPVFTIFINGNDVSNATLLRKRGIAIAIDPPEGLKYQKGSRIIFSGPDLFNNGSDSDIQVNEIFSQKYSRIIFNGTVLRGA